ncbi:MAG: membrane protein insertase YidC, partial [Chloroflexi bacterium]|nr:membrane protein insertase YidC [Chloroflexota bacterium]
MNFLLPIWNPLIVHPLEAGLRAIATPLSGFMAPGVAAALAIVLFTIFLRLLLMPLSLIQIRSQRAQMSIQPEIKALQKKFKGDREGMARAQMALYKERGINPAAGCLPLLIQMPILFGMYAAMTQLATTGLTLDQVITNQAQNGQIVYAAQRTETPLPYNQFTLATMTVTPRTADPITISVNRDQSNVQLNGSSILQATQDLTLTPGKSTSNPNPPNTATGSASIFLRPGGVENSDGTFNREIPVEVGQPYIVEIAVNANGTQADDAKTTLTYDPAALDVSNVATPPLQDLPFK